MTARELDQVISSVPSDTPILFQIEGVEAHCSSAIIKHGPYIFPTRGTLVSITEPKAKHIMLEVSYGP